MSTTPRWKLLTTQRNAKPTALPQSEKAKRKISEYCIGDPVSVVSSHSGAIDIAIGLQEPAVFLPPVDQHRSPHASLPQSDSENEPASERPEPLRRSSAFAGSSVSAPGSSNTGLNQSRPPIHRHGSSWDRVSQFANSSQHRDHSTMFLNADRRAIPTEDDYAQINGGMLRGCVVIKLAKPTKLKGISMEFYGKSKTSWNLVSQPAVLIDSHLPASSEVEDKLCIGLHHWDFVHISQFKPVNANRQSSVLFASDLYGADVATFRESAGEVRYRTQCRMAHSDSSLMVRFDPSEEDEKEIYLPFFTENQRSVRKPVTPALTCDGEIYPAGEYVYNFNLMLDPRCSETTHQPNGSVAYFLAAHVVRSGTFNVNVSGRREIMVVRSPQNDLNAPHQHPVNISRTWDDRLVYGVMLNDRNFTMDRQSRLTISLFPLPEQAVQVHQVRVYLVETVKYLYSPDPSIKATDSTLKLCLWEKMAAPQLKDSGNGTTKFSGNLLHPTEPTVLECTVMPESASDRAIQEIPQAYGRGKLGEKRFLQPDMKSRYLSVAHHLVISIRASKPGLELADQSKHFEVKIDTPITLLSKLCTRTNTSLPQYFADHSELHFEPEHDLDLPSFDDALTHPLVSAPTELVAPSDPKQQQLHVPAS